MDQYEYNLNMDTFNGVRSRLHHKSFLALRDGFLACFPRGVDPVWILTLSPSLQGDPFWRLRRREETRISHLLRIFQFGSAIYSLPILWKLNTPVALLWRHSQVKYIWVEILVGSPESGWELWISFVTLYSIFHILILLHLYTCRVSMGV